MEVVLDDGRISNDTQTVLNKWKTDFSSLFNVDNPVFDSLRSTSDIVSNTVPTDPLFNEHISLFEVKKAVLNGKQEKACGFDNISSEHLRNDTAISFRHILFIICFDTVVIPSDSGKCIFNPIAKPFTNDRRDPLSYRGIAITSSMYILFYFE